MSALDAAIAKLDSILAQLNTPPAPPATSTPAPAPAAVVADGAAAGPPKQQKKQKAPKPAASDSKPAPSATSTSAPTDVFAKANLKVGRVISVEDLDNSEKLLKTQVDIGNGETKQVIAGLKQFVAKEDLLDRLVVVIVNLKPAKLAGQPSEAMILAADTEGTGGLIVRTIQPPEGAQAGDQVVLQGSVAPEAFPKVLKSDDWKKIVPQLSTTAGQATYAGTPLCTSAGPVTVPAEVTDGSGIH